MRSVSWALTSAVTIVTSSCAAPRSQRYRDLSTELTRVEVTPAQEVGDEPIFREAPLELQPLVRAVLERNPDLQAARAAWQAALARYPQETSLPDPMVGYSIAPLSVFSDDVRLGHTVELSQELPWPGKRRLEGEVAVAEAAMARADLVEVRLRLALMTSRLYYEYYVAARAIDIVREYLALLAEQQKSIDIQLSAGRAWQDDVLALDIEVAERRRELIQMQAMLDLVAQQINAMLHLLPQLPLPPPPAQLPAPPEPEAALAELQERALRNRPELGSIEARAEAARAAIAVADRSFYPDFRLMGQYTTMFMEIEHQFMIGVGINLPIYRARRRAAVDQAEARLVQARAQRAGLADDVRREVAGAWRRYAEARQMLAVYQEQIVPAAEQRVDAIWLGLQSGRAEYVEVLRARRELEMARLAVERMLAQAHERRVELDRAQGILPTVSNGDRP